MQLRARHMECEESSWSYKYCRVLRREQPTSVVFNPLNNNENHNDRPAFVVPPVLSYTFGLLLGVFPFQY